MLKKNNIASGLSAACLALLLQPVAHAQSRAQMRESIETCQRAQELSARLACYDSAFPPIAATAERSEASAVEAPARVTEPVAESPAPVPIARAEPPPRRDPPPQPEPEPVADMARIVELEMPSVRITRFHAADGRVFVRTDATIPRWPDLPFDVEVQIGNFGTTYLRVPNLRSRFRVAVED